MKLQTLSARCRQPKNKGAARQIRRCGNIPAILYGGDAGSVPLVVDKREFEKVLHSRAGEHAIIQLEIMDHPELNCAALVKDVQHHPVRDDVLHADFLRIRLDQRIKTLVPIVLHGHARGVVEGGVLDHQLRELEIECLALEVPDEITLDVTELGMGESLHVSDIKAPANVTIITDPERTVVAVHAPRVLREAAAAPGEEAGAGEEVAEPTAETAEGKEE